MEFLTMLVVLVNLLYMLVLLFSMCSQCCKEHEDNSVVNVFRKRTTNMQRVLERRTTGGWKKSNVTRRQQHVLNPVMVEIEMTSMELSRPDTLPSVGGGSGKKFKKSTGSNTLNRAPAVVSGGSSAGGAFKPAPTRMRLTSIEAKQKGMYHKNPMKRKSKITI
jgi:hypothetical protein